MMMDNFVQILKAADPKCTKNKGNGDRDRTVWTPYQPITSEHDDVSEIVGYKVQVDRFTKTDNDPIAGAITAALLANTEIGVTILPIGYETDTGFFHHIWDCEVY